MAAEGAVGCERSRGVERGQVSTPRISVLMPVYNAAGFLAEAVESVLRQTRADFEFIIIDDGSTDASGAMLAAYAAKDRRIRLVTRPNTGYAAALNEMLGYAAAPLLARMDADDIAMPARFEEQAAYLDAHPECVAVGSRVLLIDEEGAPIRDMATSERHEQIDAEHMRGEGGAIIHPAAMIRADAVRRIGGYRIERSPAEDLDLFLRLAEVGQLANLGARLLRYRIHLGSVGHTKRAAQIRAARAAVEDAHRRRGLPAPSEPVAIEHGAIDVAGEHCKWAWWSLRGGHPATARKHALRAVGRAPWRPGCWKALACAVRGH